MIYHGEYFQKGVDYFVFLYYFEKNCKTKGHFASILNDTELQKIVYIYIAIMQNILI